MWWRRKKRAKIEPVLMREVAPAASPDPELDRQVRQAQIGMLQKLMEVGRRSVEVQDRLASSSVQLMVSREAEK